MQPDQYTNNWIRWNLELCRCRFMVTITAACEGLASELRAQRQMRVEQNKLQVRMRQFDLQIWSLFTMFTSHRFCNVRIVKKNPYMFTSLRMIKCGMRRVDDALMRSARQSQASATLSILQLFWPP